MDSTSGQQRPSVGLHGPSIDNLDHLCCASTKWTDVCREEIIVNVRPIVQEVIIRADSSRLTVNTLSENAVAVKIAPLNCLASWGRQASVEALFRTVSEDGIVEGDQVVVNATLEAKVLAALAEGQTIGGVALDAGTFGSGLSAGPG